jgi:hypothetical protein
MKRHFRQQLSTTVVLALFASAILTMLFLAQCFHATNQQEAYNAYGSFGGQTVFANTAKVNANRKKIEAAGNGIIATQAQVKTNDATDAVYIGDMDENARKLHAVRVKKGSFPKSANEIAMDETAYYRLGLSAKVGDLVTLKLQNNHAVNAHTYQLTGILYDYCDDWKKLVQDFLSDSRNVPSTDPKIPSILTGTAAENPVAMHLLYASMEEQTEYGGFYMVNPEANSAQEYLQQLDKSTTDVTLFISGFFLLITTFGTWILAHVTLQSREGFTKTLQKIGLTGGELRAQFLTQAALLTVFGWAISIPLSFGILAIIIAASMAWGTPMLLSISWWMPLVSLGLMLLTSELIFLLQAHKLQVNQAKNWKHKRTKNGTASSTFSQLWTKLCRKSQYGRMTALAVLCFFCVLILEFGTFSGETAAATHFYGIVQALGTLDYQTSVAQGAQCVELMGANMPRDEGMSPQKLAELRKSPDLDVQSAYINNCLMPAFIRVKKGHSTQILNQLMKQHNFDTDMNPGKDPAGAKVCQTAKKNFGYTDQDILISSPEIIAVDRATMAKILKESHQACTKAELDAFVQGRTVYSLAAGFKKGDTFTVSIAVVPPGATTTNIGGKGEHKDFSVTVQNAFTMPENMSKGPIAFPYGTKQSHPCIAMSAEVATAADPQLGYYQVCANRANPNDAESSARAAFLMHRTAASSKGMNIMDREENITQWQAKLRQEKWPVYALTIVLVAITLVAVAALNRIKLKSNLHSYALLCAVGMEPGRLRTNLVKDSLKSIGIGCALGFCVATVPCVMLIQHYWYEPLLNIWLSAVLPLTLLCIAVILCVTAISSAATVRKILKNSILSSLSEQY